MVHKFLNITTGNTWHNLFLFFTLYLLGCANNLQNTQNKSPNVLTSCNSEISSSNIVRKLLINEKFEDFTRTDSGIFCGEVNCQTTSMSGVDTVSFVVFSKSKYAKDKYRVYYPLQIKCVDKKDCGVCYCEKHIVNNACPKSFTVLGNEYAKDESLCFWSGSPIHGANTNTFKIMHGPMYLDFAYDDKHVYHHQRVVLGADPNSFVWDSLATDNNPDNQQYVLADKLHSWLFLLPDSIRMIQ